MQDVKAARFERVDHLMARYQRKEISLPMLKAHLATLGYDSAEINEIINGKDHA